jgi:hypothetical protein
MKTHEDKNTLLQKLIKVIEEEMKRHFSSNF